MTLPAGGALPAALAALALSAGAACSGAAPDPPAQASAGPIALGAGRARIVLTVPAGLAGRPAALTLDRLSADRQPGVLYRVELEGGPVLGHFNLYNAVTGGPAVFRFTIPAGALPPEGQPLAVIVTPQSPPDPAANVRLGRIVLTPADQP